MNRNDFFGVALGVALASIAFRIWYAYQPAPANQFAGWRFSL